MNIQPLDPRFTQILKLVSRLSNKDYSLCDQQKGNSEDVLDCILEGLDKIAEELEASRVARTHLNNVLQSMLDSLLISDLDGKITVVNRAASRLLGYHDDELLGRPMNSVLIEHSRAIGSDTYDHQECIAIAADGRQIPVSCSRSCLRNKQGEAESYIWTAHDITEGKQAEAVLRESEAKAEAVLAALPDMMFMVNRDGRFVDYQAPETAVLLVSGDQIIGKFVSEVMPAPLAGELTQRVEMALASGTVQTYEYQLPMPQGMRFYEARFAKCNASEVVAIVRDISERKQSETALRDSEFFLQKSQTVGRIGSYYFDARTGKWICSRMLDELFGIDSSFSKDVEGWISLIHPDQRDELDDYLRRYVLAEHHRFDKEYRIVRHNNDQEYWVHGLGELEFDDHGNVVKMIGTIQDITERKQTETALQESQQRFSKIFYSSPIPISVIRLSDQVVVDVNDAGLKLLGYERDELVGRSHLQLGNWGGPDQRAMVAEELREKGRITNYEIETPTKSGDSRIILLSIELMEMGGQSYLMSSSLDITDRKRAEEALRLSESHLSLVFNNTSDLQLLYAVEDDTRLRLLSVNEAYIKALRNFRLDVTAANLVGKYRDEIATEVLHLQPSAVEQESNLIKQAIRSGEPLEYEQAFDAPDGVLYANTKVIPVLNEDGICRYVLWTTQDITERKQAEAALRASESRLSLIFNNTSDLQVLFDVEPNGRLRLTAINEAYLRTARQFNIQVAAADLIGKYREEALTSVLKLPLDESESILLNQVVRTGVTAELEQAVLTPAGTFNAEVRIVPVLNADGLCRHILWTSRDITERKRAEAVVQSSNERLQQAIRVSSIGIFEHNHLTDTLYWSPEQRQMYGLDPDESLAVSAVSGALHEDDRIRVEEAVRRAHDPAGDGYFEVEHRIVDRHGTVHWLNIRSRTFFEGEGSARHAVRTVGATVDTTEHKYTEDSLRRSEARYRALVENSPDHITILDRQYRIQYINSLAEGFVLEQVIGKTTFDFLPPDSHDRIRTVLDTVIQSGKPGHYEVQSYRRDGSTGWMDARIVPILESGQVTGITQVVTDITEQKRVETALRDSEFFLQKSQTVGRIGSYYFDIRTGKWISSNMLDELFGIDDRFPKDFDGWISLVHPDQREEMSTYLRDHVLAEHHRFDKEYRIVRRDNHQEFWVHGLGELEFDDRGNPIKMIGTIQDITQHKRLEQDLLLTQFCVDQASLGIMRTGSEGQILSVNQQLCRWLGYTALELCNMHIFDLDPNFPKNRWTEHRGLIRRQGADTFETVHRRKDGSTLPVEVTTTYIPFENKEFSVSFIRDITERKRMLEELQASEERLRQAVRAASIGIFDHDQRVDVIYWSPEQRRIYGWEADESVTPPAYLQHVHPEDRERIAEAVRQAHDPAGDGFFDVEHRVIDRSGVVHWLTTKSKTYFEGEGTARYPYRTVGAVMDNTERRLMEDALRTSEARLREAQEIAHIGNWDWNLTTNELYWSDETYRIFGLDPQDFELTIVSFMQCIYPEDLGRVQQNVNKALEGQVYAVEHRLRRPDGQTRWVEQHGQVIFDQSRVPTRMYGTTQDITARKQAESERQKLVDIVETSSDFVGIADLDGRVQYINPAGLKLVGIESPIEPQALRVTDFLPIEDHESFTRDHLTTVLKVGRWLGESRLKHLGSGETIPVEMSSVLIRDSASGDPIALANISRDIRERKRAESAIQQLNRDLEQRVVERTAELEAANTEIKNFAYIVSHDLRAPLVNLKGFSGELKLVLKDVEALCGEALYQIDPSKQNKLVRILHEDIPESLRFIESSVSNMDSFTKAVLRLSRLGRLQLELVDVNVRRIVEKSLEALNYQITKQSVTVTVGDLPVIVADTVSMEQIFGNILSNSIAYLLPGRPGKIDISAERFDSETVFHIRDNGRGIAREDYDKVFAPFRRAGKQDIPGEGMGLAYVQTLVRRHGGRISFKSEVGVGTTFTFTIASHP